MQTLLQLHFQPPPPETSKTLAASNISTFSNTSSNSPVIVDDNLGTASASNNGVITSKPIERISEEDAIAAGYTIIKTAEDLNNIRNDIDSDGDINYNKYILMNDIDLSSIADWDPINGEFQSVFNGNGYSIKNLTSTKNGLFARVGSCEIINLNMENVNITSTSGYVGALAASGSKYGGGIHTASVINCSFSGNISTSGNYAIGSVIGNAIAFDFQYVESSINITGATAGGLLGNVHSARETNITNCAYTGNITANTASGTKYIGGLIGKTEYWSKTSSLSITNVLISGERNIPGDAISGIVIGRNDDDLTLNIKNCFYNKDKSTTTDMIGENDSSAILNVSGSFTELTTAEIADGKAFIDAGWDTSIWEFSGASPSIKDFWVLNRSRLEFPTSNGSYYRIENISGRASDIVEQINAKTAETGIIASLDSQNRITLKNADGSNKTIYIPQASFQTGHIETRFDYKDLYGLKTTYSITGTQKVTANTRVSAGTIIIDGQEYSTSGGTVADVISELNSALNSRNPRVYLNNEGYIVFEYDRKFDIKEGTSDFVDITKTATIPTKTFIPNTQKLTEAEAIAAGYTVIKTADDLKKINDDLSGYYILMNDIDLSSISNWTPLGNLMTGELFSGVLNGNGFKIKNLTVNDRTGLELSGLFYATMDAMIENLGIENAHISAASTGGGYAGILAGGAMNTIITNCYTTGTVSGDSAGGLIGMTMQSTINNSHSSADITGTTAAGGFIGADQMSQITNCYSAGKVQISQTGGYAGGFLGYGDSANNCFWDTEKSGMSVGVGTAGNISGLNGLTSADMQNSQNFTNAGWDTNIWEFSPGSAPTLKIFSTTTTPNPPDPDQPGGGTGGTDPSDPSNPDNPNTPGGGTGGAGDVPIPGAVRLQIGSDSSSTSAIYVDTSFDLGAFDVDFSSADSCAAAIEDIDEVLSRINTKRSEFGAVINRLSSILESQTTTIQNFTSAKSTIMDADIANESADFVKNQILQQTSSALLAQSQNLHASIVLSLIG